MNEQKGIFFITLISSLKEQLLRHYSSAFTRANIQKLLFISGMNSKSSSSNSRNSSWDEEHFSPCRITALCIIILLFCEFVYGRADLIQQILAFCLRALPCYLQEFSNWLGGWFGFSAAAASASLRCIASRAMSPSSINTPPGMIPHTSYSILPNYDEWI